MFKDLKNRLKPVCIRTLRRQVLEYIKYTKRISHTQDYIPTPAEIELYDGMSEYLQRPKLFALPSSQRQLITLILRKLLASSSFAIASTLDSLSYKLKKLLEEAEKQKVMKELGIEVTLKEEPCVMAFEREKNNIKEYVILIHYLAKRKGEIKIGRDIREFKWLDIKNLPEDCAPNIKTVLEYFKNKI